MDIQEKEVLIAEIERFKEEALKMHTVQVLADTYKHSSLFDYSIDSDGSVIWYKAQARQLWDFWQAKAQAVPGKDAIIKKLSDQLYSQEMKTSAARTLCETACELLDDYAHQDAMVILNDLEQAMKEPAND
jgi:hypothetical protein